MTKRAIPGRVEAVVRLRRCPFCGSRARIEEHNGWFRVRCGGAVSVFPRPSRDVAECEMQPATPMFALSASEAARMWNRRAPNAAHDGQQGVTP